MPRVARRCSREGLSILIRVLYPVVPHIGCALWDELGFAAKVGALLDAPWPQVDPAALAQDEIELVLQVNGKLRGKLTRSGGRRRQGDRSGRARERGGCEARRRRADQARDRRAGKARQCRGLTRAGTPSDSWSRPRSLAALAGCGFHLRGDVTYAFSTLYVNAPPSTPFAAELKRALAGGSTTLVDSRRGRAGDPRSVDHHRRQAGAVAVGRRPRAGIPADETADVFAARHRRQGLAAGGRNRHPPLVHVQRVRSARARSRRKRSS